MTDHKNDFISDFDHTNPTALLHPELDHIKKQIDAMQHDVEVRLAEEKRRRATTEEEEMSKNARNLLLSGLYLAGGSALIGTGFGVVEGAALVGEAAVLIGNVAEHKTTTAATLPESPSLRALEKTEQ